MKKSNLKDGWVVQTRNGTIWVLLNNKLQCKSGWMPFDKYNEDLQCCDDDIIVDKKALDNEFEIVKVGIYTGRNIFDLNSKQYEITWIWQRGVSELMNPDELNFLRKLKGQYGCHYFEVCWDSRLQKFKDDEDRLYVIGYGAKEFSFMEIPVDMYCDEFNVNLTFDGLDKNRIYIINDLLIGLYEQQ